MNHCGVCGCKSCRCPTPESERRDREYAKEKREESQKRVAKKKAEADALLSDALSCLQGLVDTQKLKEEHGKTDVYLRKRDHYWSEARRILGTML